MKKVEAKREGQKISMNSGTINIKFTGLLLTDYEGRWETNEKNTPIWKFFRGFYDKYIIRQRVEEYESKIEKDVKTLINETKSLLALEKRRGWFILIKTTTITLQCIFLLNWFMEFYLWINILN